jgi:hypothetical protein
MNLFVQALVTATEKMCGHFVLVLVVVLENRCSSGAC